MQTIWNAAAQSLAGTPAFLLYLVAAFALVAIFIVLYSLLTPQREIALVREGNAAAAISLGGAILGFAIPLSKSISQSRDMVDMVVWAIIALAVQLAAFFLSGLVISHEAKRISEGDLAAAWYLAFTAVAAGLINSACMTS
jgi:putative membrane protein